MPSGNCDHFEATALNNNAYRNIRAKRQLAPSDQRNPRGSLATGLERSNDRFVATRRSFAHRALRFLEQPPVDALLVELVEARHDLQSVSILEITQAHHARRVLVTSAADIVGLGASSLLRSLELVRRQSIYLRL